MNTFRPLHTNFQRVLWSFFHLCFEGTRAGCFTKHHCSRWDVFFFLSNDHKLHHKPVISQNQIIDLKSTIIGESFFKSNWMTKNFLPQHSWTGVSTTKTVSVRKNEGLNEWSGDGTLSWCVKLPFYSLTDGLQSRRQSVLRAPPSVNLLTVAALLGPAERRDHKFLWRRCQDRPTDSTGTLGARRLWRT